MPTVQTRKGWGAGIADAGPGSPGGVTFPSDKRPREHDVEAWDRTDRPLRRPARAFDEAPDRLARTIDPDRARWLEENDVQTEFLDAGIGCCWFAYRGDQEPVSGETEDEAIARLTQATALEPSGGR